MSGHGHDDAPSAYEAHDDHHETSSDDFPADEPRSPGWLPLLGGALLLAGIFVFVIFSADSKNDASGPADTAAAPAPPLPMPPARRPAMGLPPGMQLPPNRLPLPPHEAH
jgi:hypothetical protein